MISGAAFALFGLLFMQVPDHALTIIGTILYALFLGYTGFKLISIIRKIRKKEAIKKIRTALYSIIFGTAWALLFRQNALTISQNFLLWVMFIGNTYLNLSLFLKAERSQKIRCVWLLLNTAISLLFGLVTLVTVGGFKGMYLFFAGSYLLITGIIDIGISTLDNARMRVRREREEKDQSRWNRTR